MIILRAIGGFFVRIGRWIKDTAWVQPLLIVGGIFAIIFSIPYISSWVSSWFSGGNAANSYYAQFKVSLSGADKNDSDSNKLFNYMSGDDSQKDRWGEKFFVVFVQEDCHGCEDIYKGFEVLQSNWNTGEFAKPNDNSLYHDFKIYTIYIDTEETINNESQNLFQKYFFNQYDILFEDLLGNMQDSNYAKNKGSSYITELQTLDDVENFATPTVFLYDPNGGTTSSQLGVSEVLFTVQGKNNESGSYPIARTLYDCWYHQDIFGPNYSK